VSFVPGRVRIKNSGKLVMIPPNMIAAQIWGWILGSEPVQA
jgi:hypothetical protein